MKISLYTGLIVAALGMAVTADQPGSTVHVKYVTGESVYLDGGMADSLLVGDRLEIRRADTLVAELEVSFAAEHSASCKILVTGATIVTGDIATVTLRVARPPAEISAPADKIDSAAIAQPQLASSRAKIPFAKISGSASIQIHNWNDRTATNLDFRQPSFRFNLKANRLGGKEFFVNMRITSRYNKRTREYNSDVPRTEWRNRIYQLSFGYANDQAPFSFEFGRVISNRMSGIGYIDGMLVQKGVTEEFHVGAFAGTQPEWQYSDFQTSLKKYGGYLSFTKGDFKSNRLESTVAAAGEYHGSIVSREFLFIRNTLGLDGRWNFYQSAEIDFNRDWRKIKTGTGTNLSNLFLSARGRFAKWLSAGVSYDNRRNYWTYETRTLTDSLFDDVLRRGVRADISLRPHRDLFFTSNFGYHKRSVDQGSTRSYSIGLNKASLFSIRQSLNLQFAGFVGPFTDGYNFSARFSRTLWRGNMITVGYGAYIYSFGNGNTSRKNDWIQFSGQFDIVRRIYSSATYEYDMGDDTKGHRIIGELGYRF